MAKERIYSAGLGIEAGDRVLRTAWSTGPYEIVSVTRPKRVVDYGGDLVILPWPVVSLTVILDNSSSPEVCRTGYINEIRRDNEGKYFSGKDWVEIEKARAGYLLMGLFDSPADDDPPGYDFQEGVDYACLDGELWKCGHCGTDYNGLTVPVVATMVPGDPRGRRPLCPTCGRWPDCLYVVQPDQTYTSFYLQLQGRMVDQYRKYAPERLAYMVEPTTKEKRKRKKNESA